jgi:hypothetical protein
MEPPSSGLSDWLDIQDAALPPDGASQLDVKDLARVLETLDGRQHRMALLLQAMVDLLEVQGLLSQRQLVDRAQAIDLGDGVADGRQIRQVSRRCGHCGRLNPLRRQRCLYCGGRDLLPLSSARA